MGYQTYVSGNIAIEPPLNARELEEMGIRRPVERYLEPDRWPFMTNRYSNKYPSDVAILTSTENFINDDGDQVTRVTGVAIVSTYTDSFKAYHVEEDLQEMVRRICNLPTIHTLRGHLNGDGEDSGDVWRLKVINERATKFVPEVIWPVEVRDDSA